MSEKTNGSDEKKKKINDGNKNILDSKLIFLRELVDYDKSIQAGFAQKVIVEQKIRNMICILCNDLEICKPQEYDKDRVNQIQRFLSILICYHRVILPDLVQNAMITETIGNVICRLEQILKI